jgi:hypothetical protein
MYKPLAISQHDKPQKCASKQAGVLLRLWRSAEGGSMDGGTLPDIIFMPMLFALVMMALFFTLLGFYRIGASYAAQQGALVGSVSPGTGDTALSSSWFNWTNKNFPGGDFSYDPASRSAEASLSATQTFDYLGLGPWIFGITGHTYTRSERFYPGGPVCHDANCTE